MIRLSLTALALGAVALSSWSFASPESGTSEESSTLTPVLSMEAEASALHCQVPCGIYGDKMRIDMMIEDAATIEKAMKSLAEMEGKGFPNKNQMVRWIMTKDEHAQHIQEMVASYWLAQRVKKPEGDLATYHKQLAVLHAVTITAMKCKQTADVSHVDKLRKSAKEFAEAYFSADDLKHLRQHFGDHR